MRRMSANTFGLIATVIVLGACSENGDKSNKDNSGDQHVIAAADGGTTGGNHDAQTSAQDGQGSVGDGQASTSGNKSCTAIKVCQGPCTDDSCLTRCLNLGSAAGKAAFQAIDTCNSNAASGACKDECSDAESPSCFGCSYIQCVDVEMACLTEGKTGTLSCDKVAECEETCLYTDDVCLGKCLAQGTNTAQGQWRAGNVCYMEKANTTCASKCGEDSDPGTCDACASEACASLLAPCMPAEQ